jgi:hypothetical protein
MPAWLLLARHASYSLTGLHGLGFLSPYQAVMASFFLLYYGISWAMGNEHAVLPPSLPFQSTWDVSLGWAALFAEHVGILSSAVWTCELYPFPPASSMDVQDVSFHNQQYSKDVQDVSLSTASSMDVRAVSLSTRQQYGCAGRIPFH